MKVAILGKDGMLGRAVTEIFKNDRNVDLLTLDRAAFEVSPKSFNEVGAQLTRALSKQDCVINCVGAIKPMFNAGSLPGPTYTNAIFPHYLADWGELCGVQVIHITTDCVYSGNKGQYVESDAHDALDEYGKSKSLGEPENAMVIRTSIIGPELVGRKRSFLEWLRGESGKLVKGFTNHYWNGLSTYELAFSLLDIIDHDVWMPGVYHLFGEDVTKYDMVTEIIAAYGLEIGVEAFETDSPVDRTLRTEKDLKSFIQPQNFSDMIADMHAIEMSSK